MDSRRLEAAQKELDRMLMILWTAGYVELEPKPQEQEQDDEPSAQPIVEGEKTQDTEEQLPPYKPEFAHPTSALEKFSVLRGIHPLYGIFLVNQLGIADRNERVQAMESVLELPGSVAHFVRVPSQEELPPGPLATLRLDPRLLQLGLASAEELGAGEERDPEQERGRLFQEERVFVLTLAEKLRRLFNHDFPGVHDVYTQSVWAAGEILEFGGDFNKYVTSKRLQKQEGMIFRHLLRLVLLVFEFMQLCPPDVAEDEWTNDLQDIADRLTETCRAIDPMSTDKTLEQASSVAEVSQ
jgi:hypothetical protein